MECLNCRQTFCPHVTLKSLISFRPLILSQQCSACQNQFVQRRKKGCRVCGKESASDKCADCISWQNQYPTIEFNLEALFEYNDEMKEWMSLYKFKGHRALSYCFAEEMANYFWKHRKALVIPIPLSAERYRDRGFNQVEELLEAGVIPYEILLAKPHQSDEQNKKTKTERLKGKQPFVLTVEAQTRIKGREVIIVDDIYTTGRTMYWAIELIASCHPKSINGFCLAR